MGRNSSDDIEDQDLLGGQAHVLGVLGLEVLEPTDIGHLHDAELVTPAKKDLADPVALSALGHDRNGAALGFALNPDDLLLGGSLPNEALLAC